MKQRLAERGVGHLVVAGAQTDQSIRCTLHGAIARGYDATLVGDAHTTVDFTSYGAPPPEQVIAHTNLYWKYQTAPGRAGAVVNAGRRWSFQPRRSLESMAGASLQDLAVPGEARVGHSSPRRRVSPLAMSLRVSEALGSALVPANVWRYEPGAKGKRHVHAKQEETFVVLSGHLTMYVGEPPERVEVAAGSVINVPGGTPLQSANHGTEDLLVYAYGYPPDQGAEVLEPFV